MLRKVIILSVAIGAFGAVAASASAQSKAAKIQSAISAAPKSIAANAAVIDWPDKNGKQELLRAGTNGWTCMPSEAPTKYITRNAICFDATFGDMLGALLTNKPPKVQKVGYSYMLSNDTWESNTTPMAPVPTSTNEWHHVGPHVMVVYPDKAMLAGLPMKPSKTGPYVMWPTTAYAHVMWPVK